MTRSLAMGDQGNFQSLSPPKMSGGGHCKLQTSDHRVSSFGNQPPWGFPEDTIHQLFCWHTKQPLHKITAKCHKTREETKYVSAVVFHYNSSDGR